MSTTKVFVLCKLLNHLIYLSLAPGITQLMSSSQ